MKQLFAMGILITALSLSANAQNTFSSGSTGADGAFSPTTSQTIQVPASGVFNYTTVNIPTSVVITYVPNSTNTPLTILASGAVQINGTIHVDGQNGSPLSFGGLGGPGGARGGTGGINGAPGTPGDGPGGGKGGTYNPSGSPICAVGGGAGFQLPGSGTLGGAVYGTPSLVPLVGGSGGGGGCAAVGNNTGGGGGGGGGAILIASSSTITFSSGASITATGGFCNGCGTNASLFSAGAGGSGGAIRIAANSVTGIVSFNVLGGSSAGAGYIRIEAFTTTGFSPGSSGNTPISSALPSSAIPTNLPALQIVSVAGIAVPSNPIGSFQGSPDVVLPANQANPVSIVINAANIPVGTTVNLTAIPASGTSTSATTTLAGTLSSSTGTASISLSSGLSVLTASTIINLATLGDLQPLFINGEKVDKIEVAARFGGGSQIAYITHSGRRIQVR